MFEKTLLCALPRNGDNCVSKIVGEIKHVKSGKLFLKHRISQSAFLSNAKVSVFETQQLPVYARLKRVPVPDGTSPEGL